MGGFSYVSIRKERQPRVKVEEEKEILLISTSVSLLVTKYVPKLDIPIVDNFKDHDPKLPIGSRLDVTP